MTSSGFYVAGVPAGKIERMVDKRVARQERRLKRCPKVGSTERRAEKHRRDLLDAPPENKFHQSLMHPSFARNG